MIGPRPQTARADFATRKLINRSSFEELDVTFSLLIGERFMVNLPPVKVAVGTPQTQSLAKQDACQTRLRRIETEMTAVSLRVPRGGAADRHSLRSQAHAAWSATTLFGDLCPSLD